ncbi:MAG: chorismate mutase [Chromatiales bacterium]|nr:chorismate mutase [Chromatiales bacterium]
MRFLAATDELLRLMIGANQVCAEDVASVFFTTTNDLNADYPALAARALGWHDAALDVRARNELCRTVCRYASAS